MGILVVLLTILAISIPFLFVICYNAGKAIDDDPEQEKYIKNYRSKIR